MSASRTSMVVKNIYFSLTFQVVNLVAEFIARTIFIRTLGVDYLGVNGLFANLLTILSLAELGIGGAIIFNMYKPLAIGNHEKLKALMYFYKKTYRIIGLVVASVGLLLVPILEFLMKDQPDISENLKLIYILFLLNTVFSYFFAHKRSIIEADQRGYIVNMYVQSMQLCRRVIQIVVLITYSNYLIYLVLQIVFTFLGDYIVSRKADKLYPYLKDKDVQTLTIEEKSEIFTNVKALSIYRVGSVILGGTSNVIISALIGIREVGLISNYTMVILAVQGILGQITNSFTASIGNVNTTETPLKKEEIFNKMFFIIVWIYGFTSLGLLIFLNPFITVWLGESYVLSDMMVFALVLFFYIQGVHSVLTTYRITSGIFVKGKYVPIFAAILNIILSLLLGNIFGLIGILISPPIARLITYGIVDPLLIYVNVFNSKPKTYFIKYFKYICLYGIVYIMFKQMIHHIVISNIFILILAALGMTIVFNVIMVVILYKKSEFKEIIGAVKRLRMT